MRTHTIDFHDFMDGSWREKYESKVMKFVKIGTGAWMVMVPKAVFAASKEEAFMDVLASAFSILDWLCVGVIIVSGVSWMFGHRTKAIELLMGASIGYVLARHAVDIKDFLKGIGGGV